MRKIRVLLLLFIPIGLIADSRNLIVLLDDGEIESVASDEKSLGEGFGVITSNLVIALIQKTAPLLVTASVWRNFVERRMMYQDFTNGTLSIEDLYKKYQYLTFFKSKEQIASFKGRCAILSGNILVPELSDAAFLNAMTPYYACGTTAFDEQEWHMYAVNSYFYLLIPKEYSKNLEVVKDSPFAGIRVEELQLGLKLGKRLERAFDPLAHPLYITNLGEYYRKMLPKLFITKKDIYSADPKKNEAYTAKYLHSWFFF